MHPAPAPDAKTMQQQPDALKWQQQSGARKRESGQVRVQLLYSGTHMSVSSKISACRSSSNTSSMVMMPITSSACKHVRVERVCREEPCYV